MTSALVVLQLRWTLSTDMATSPAQIRALPPRRVLSLSPYGVHLGNFIVTDPPFPRRVTISDGRKALTAIPPTLFLEENFIKQTLHITVDTKQLSWYLSEQWRTMNPNTKQVNNNSLNIQLSFNNCDTKVFAMSFSFVQLSLSVRSKHSSYQY